MQYDDAKRDKYSNLNARKYLFSNHEEFSIKNFKGDQIR